MAERLKSKSVQIRRAIASYLVKGFWPIEFREETPGNLALLDNVIAEGHGVIGLIPHFSRSDFLTILASLTLSSRELRRSSITIPIAAHQRTTDLEYLVRFSDINLATIITGDTRKKEKELVAKDKSVPWQNIDPTEAINSYLNISIEELKQGGIVFIAPGGGRRSLLLPFKGGPISRLENRAKETSIDHIALFSIGLEVGGATDYSKLRGLNLLRKHIVTLGRVTKREEIKGNIDEWGYQDMLRLAPQAYRPKTRTNEITGT